MSFGAADIPFMLRDMGVDVVFGGTTVKGLLDTNVPDAALDVEGAMGVAETVTTLVIQRGSLPGLAHGSQITADGDGYTVRSIRPFEDGALVQLLVQRAA